MLVRMRKWVLVADDTADRLRKISPYLLLATLIGYLLFGAGSFWFFEKGQVENAARQYYLQVASTRRLHARNIAQKLFNDTKNLFVVMDTVTANRVEKDIYEGLSGHEREYEKLIDYPRPNFKREWNFSECLTYAWSLLTTLGHSTKAPRTILGQLFALLYTIVGVPLFIITLLLLAHRAFTYLRNKSFGRKDRKVYIFSGILTIYVLFLLGFALFLYHNGIVASYWRGINAAIFSCFSVHTVDYARFSEADKLLTQFATTISLLLGIVTLYYGILVYETREISTDKVSSTDPPTAALATTATNDVPRFHVIVDDTGATKLQTVT